MNSRGARSNMWAIEILIFISLFMIGFGIYLMHPPLAFIVVGTILFLMCAVVARQNVGKDKPR